MSTVIQSDEIEQIADALLYDAVGPRQLSCVWEQPRTANVEDYKDRITAWANRVYIANQCAYILTYAHRADCDNKILMLNNEAQWKHGGDLILNYPRFYRVLESVKYNLYSNGGQVMLCAEDMRILDDITAMVAREIVGTYQKEKGRV